MDYCRIKLRHEMMGVLRPPPARDTLSSVVRVYHAVAPAAMAVCIVVYMV